MKTRTTSFGRYGADREFRPRAGARRRLGWWVLFLLLVAAGAGKMHAHVPEWTVNPAGYTFSATVTALLYVNDTLSNDAGNIVGAFVNDEVRGVATPVPFGAQMLYFVTVYSDSGSGETVTFRMYSAKDTMVGEIGESVPFVANGSTGAPQSPFLLHGYLSTLDRVPVVRGIPDQTVEIGETFQTFDLDDYLTEYNGDAILWSASGNRKLNVAIDSEHRVTLTPKSPAFTGGVAIIFTATDSTANRHAGSDTAVFTIRSVDHSPTFGTIPGQARTQGEAFTPFDLDDYLTEVDGDSVVYGFFFPPPAHPEPRPEWSVNAPGFQYTMTLTAEVTSLEQPAGGAGHLLAAFSGNELRGVAAPTSVLGGWIYFLSIFSNTENDPITFRFYDSTAQRAIAIQERLVFHANDVVGEPLQPYRLHAGNLSLSIDDAHVVSVAPADAAWFGSELVSFWVRDAHALSDGGDTASVLFTTEAPAGAAAAEEGVPGVMHLEQNYPNPFNPGTHVRFTMYEFRFVSLKVYNILGEEVASLLNEEREAGHYSIEWNAGGLPSGVYYYRLTAGEFADVKRMLLMR